MSSTSLKTGISIHVDQDSEKEKMIDEEGDDFQNVDHHCDSIPPVSCTLSNPEVSTHDVGVIYKTSIPRMLQEDKSGMKAKPTRDENFQEIMKKDILIDAEKGLIAFRRGMPLAEKIKKYIQSRSFVILSIIIIVCATFLSTLIKFLATTRENYGLFVIQNTLIAFYFFFDLYFVLELIVRIIFLRLTFFYDNGICLLNILDMLLIMSEIGVNITTLILTVETGIVSSFGAIITLRIMILVVKVPGLIEIVSGMKKAFTAIMLVGFFGAVMIYCFSFVAYMFFSPHVYAANMNCEVCNERFNTLQNTLMTMFQVLTADAWCEDIVLPLGQQSYMGRLCYVFFVLYFSLGTYIILNLIAAVIIDGIMDDGTDEGMQFEVGNNGDKKTYRGMLGIFLYAFRIVREGSFLDLYKLDTILTKRNVTMRRRETEMMFREGVNHQLRQIVSINLELKNEILELKRKIASTANSMEAESKGMRTSCQTVNSINTNQ